MKVQVNLLMLNVSKIVGTPDEEHIFTVMMGFKREEAIKSITALMKAGHYDVITYTHETDTIDENFADRIFGMYQHIDENSLEFNHRSLSVGDIITVIHEDKVISFVVMMCGFIKLKDIKLKEDSLC